MTFSPADIPDLKGKVAIVTGANTGIGKPTALELARKGAHVFLACRSQEKTLPVIEEIKKTTGNEKVEFLLLDLSSLKSVQKAAQEFQSRKVPLHILINNAGVMMLPEYQTTQDGIEMQWGTNFLGHFLFTTMLLPVIEKSAPSRIVNVSSSAHQWADFPAFVPSQFSDPQHYNARVQYGISKVSNILFSLQLNELLQKKGVKNVYVNSLHPGVINTELTRYMAWYVQLVKPLLGWILLTPENGALTQLYVATHPDIETKPYHAQFFVPTAQLSDCTDLGKSKEKAKELWAYAEKVIQEKLK